MYSLNRACIIGNLTRDPELRKTPNGTSVASIGVATNRKWTGPSGEDNEETEFHNVVAWARLAEICAEYLKKGTKVYFEGRLRTRTWESEDGHKNYRTEIIAENMIILDKKGNTSTEFSGNETSGQEEEKKEKSEKKPKKVDAESKDGEEISVEDLPF